MLGTRVNQGSRLTASHSESSGWGGLVTGFTIAILAVASSEWLLALSAAVLVVAWKILGGRDRAPVIAAAFTFQWMQVTIALFYKALTGREIFEITGSNYRPMVLVGLASIVCLFFGYYLGAWERHTSYSSQAKAPVQRFSFLSVSVAYVIGVATSGVVQAMAFRYPAFTQLLLILTLARYAVLYLLVSRLMSPQPRWSLMIILLMVELAFGFTGFFADFREPLAVMGLAIIGSSGRRRRSTWFALALIVSLGFGAAVTWTAIKPIVRAKFSETDSRSARLAVAVETIGPALKTSGGLWVPQVDKLVSRMWAVYYPALALARVPSIVPYERGLLLLAAIKNVLMPRLLFPEKGELGSDSDKVRKYTGIMVAGRDRMTSFAFGYAAESYVDFGLPLMFVPILAFGFLLGLADRLLRGLIHTTELLSAVRVVIFWSSMYLFETSWAMLIGKSLTLIIVLGGGALLLERILGLTRASGKGHPHVGSSRGIARVGNPAHTERRAIAGVREGDRRRID
jgi:hypothetical protein